MKSKFIIGFLLFSVPLQMWSLNLSAKQKYSYVLLTDNFGILNENDLAAYTWGYKPRPFTPEEDSGGYNYWQCFPREQISVTIEDMGYSSENFGWIDTLAELTIKVWIKPGVFHQYDMRKVWPVSKFLKDFKRFHQLMKNEKYVNQGVLQEEYSWIFDKIKTTKGCASYFGNCDRTYEEWLQENKG